MDELVGDMNDLTIDGDEEENLQSGDMCSNSQLIETTKYKRN